MKIKLSIRRLIALLAVLCLLATLFVFLTPKFYLRSGLAETVTPSSLEDVRIGATIGEVVSILGEPRLKTHSEKHDVAAFYYSRPIGMAFIQPCVLVTFKGGLVHTVEVRKNNLWGADTVGFYYRKDAESEKKEELSALF